MGKGSWGIQRRRTYIDIGPYRLSKPLLHPLRQRPESAPERRLRLSEAPQRSDLLVRPARALRLDEKLVPRGAVRTARKAGERRGLLAWCLGLGRRAPGAGLELPLAGLPPGGGEGLAALLLVALCFILRVGWVCGV